MYKDYSNNDNYVKIGIGVEYENDKNMDSEFVPVYIKKEDIKKLSKNIDGTCCVMLGSFQIVIYPFK